MKSEMEMQTDLRDQGYTFLEDVTKEKRKFWWVVKLLEAIAYGKSK